jgi:hypothetical protein
MLLYEQKKKHVINFLFIKSLMSNLIPTHVINGFTMHFSKKITYYGATVVFVEYKCHVDIFALSVDNLRIGIKVGGLCAAQKIIRY